MDTKTFDLIMFTLGNMIAVLILSACLLFIGWATFLAIWSIIHILALGWCAWKLFSLKSQTYQDHPHPHPLDYDYGDYK